uniref:Uncharacterized protein n=1 Tax=Fundulus heteroclitus TaxID=8078 RepID=A0A3Q2TEX4_FUNHE
DPGPRCCGPRPGRGRPGSASSAPSPPAAARCCPPCCRNTDISCRYWSAAVWLPGPERRGSARRSGSGIPAGHQSEIHEVFSSIRHASAESQPKNKPAHLVGRAAVAFYRLLCLQQVEWLAAG